MNEQQREYLKLFRTLHAKREEFRSEEAKLLKMWNDLAEDDRAGLASPSAISLNEVAAPQEAST